MKCDTKIGKFPEFQAVQKSFERRDHYLMADCGIKADTGTYGKTPVFIFIIQYTDIHGGVVRRRKNLFQSTVDVRRKSQTSGKVIA